MKNTNPKYAIPFYQLKKTASAHTNACECVKMRGGDEIWLGN
jgi:hypothetical protein